MLKVLHAGIYASVQDLGRKGFANIGVPTAGVMDEISAKTANALLQNDSNDALIEILFGNCKFEFTKPTLICITGADFSATLNDKPLKLNEIVKVKSGEVLSFGKRKYGARSYLAVKGGFLSPMVLNSRSFFKGITKQFKLNKNTTIPYAETNEEFVEKYAKVKINLELFNTLELSCLKAPEYDLLSDYQKELLINQKFTISADNNRVGYRLQEKIENKLPSMLTSSVLAGTVQLTPSGQLIIMMKDAQVTGGYPRVLQLTQEAISVLAQKTTNEQVLFKSTSFSNILR